MDKHTEAVMRASGNEGSWLPAERKPFLPEGVGKLLVLFVAVLAVIILLGACAQVGDPVSESDISNTTYIKIDGMNCLWHEAGAGNTSRVALTCDWSTWNGKRELK